MPDSNLHMRVSGGAGDDPAGGPGPTRARVPSVSVPPGIPDHELVRPIGRGSYGEVWLARSVMGPWRAVKIIHRRSFDHDRPFERELEGIRRFEPISRSHPSQLNVLHVGRNDAAGCFYYVMELADQVGPAVSEAGSTRAIVPESYVPRTLRSELLTRGRLTFDECLTIAMALTTALGHLHGQGLVHRDIKPSNIIFVNGVAKLADIGLVAAAEATLSEVGTEGYLPREGPGTPQADLFGLGKVLYEMATGRDRRDFPELSTDLIGDADRAAFLELNEVILKACQADSRRRYATAAEMRADLDLLKRGVSISRRRLVGQRWRIVAGVAALGAVALLVLAGIQQFRRDDPHGGDASSGAAWGGTGGDPGRKDSGAEVTRSISVRVVDGETLRGLAGARVRLRIARDHRPEVTRETFADEAGSNRVEVPVTWVSEFTYEVEAAAAGFVTKRVQWSSELQDELESLPDQWEIRLARAARGGGVVRGEDGEGIPGVLVSLRVITGSSNREQETLGSSPHEEKTDASGRWMCFHGIERMANVEFRLFHPEYTSTQYVTAAVGAGVLGEMGFQVVKPEQLQSGWVEMAMRRGVMLAGRVVDPSGRPVVGARVTRHSELEDPFAGTITDRDGAFAFRNATAGEVGLFVEADGFAPARITTAVPLSGSTLLCQLKPGRRLDGRVVDDLGQPVVGARVQSADAPPGSWNVRTGPDGAFQHPSASSEPWAYLVSEADGFDPAIVVLAADGASKTIRLVGSAARDQLQCVVRVQDAVTHRPVPRFQALVHERVSDTLVQWVLGPRKVEEGKDGVVRIRIDGTTPEYDLEIRAEGYLTRRTGWFRRREGNRELTVTLNPSDLLVGTVLLPDGQPAAEAEVVLATREEAVVIGDGRIVHPAANGVARTDARGRVRLNSKPGVVRIVAVHSAGCGDVEVAQFALTQQLELLAWGRIEGTLTVAGLAQTNGRVRLMPSTMSSSEAPRVLLDPFRFSAKSDVEGRYVLKRVPAGTFTLWPELPNVYGRGLRVTVPPGSSQRLDLALGGGRTLVGRLVAAQAGNRVRWDAPGHRFELHGTPSRPAPLGWVERVSGSGNGELSLEFAPAADGSFRVEAIPEGVYRLEAWLAEDTPDGSTVSEVAVSLPHRVARGLTVPGVDGGDSASLIDLGVLELARPTR